MKIFNNSDKALESMKSKYSYYLNSTCPYNPDGRLCGSWCALFYINHAVKNEHQDTSAYAILGCKSGEKYLYINEFVED